MPYYNARLYFARAHQIFVFLCDILLLINDDNASFIVIQWFGSRWQCTRYC